MGDELPLLVGNNCTNGSIDELPMREIEMNLDGNDTRDDEKLSWEAPVDIIDEMLVKNDASDDDKLSIKAPVGIIDEILVDNDASDDDKLSIEAALDIIDQILIEVGILEIDEELNTIVLVDEDEFACNGLVLNTQSNYIQSLGGVSVIDLRQKPISSNIFDGIYKYMIKSSHEYKFEKVDILAKLRAAHFLQMPDLIDACHISLDSELYNESMAFKIMHGTRKYPDLSYISLAMVTRISTCILDIQNDPECLELRQDQICSLLMSNLLAVNSETEVLYVALRWLDARWPKRRSSVSEVLGHIRFPYLSKIALCQLEKPIEINIGPFGHILEEFRKSPDNMKLIQEGFLYSALAVLRQTSPNEFQQLSTAEKDQLIPRRWIRDERCRYHGPVTRLCPNMDSVSYNDFVGYLTKLRLIKNYACFFRKPKDDQFIMSDCKLFLSPVAKTYMENLYKSRKASYMANVRAGNWSISDLLSLYNI